MSRAILSDLKRTAQRRLSRSHEQNVVRQLLDAAMILVVVGKLTVEENAEFQRFVGVLLMQPDHQAPRRRIGNSRRKKTRPRRNRIGKKTGKKKRARRSRSEGDRYALTHRKGRADRSGTPRREEPGRVRKNRPQYIGKRRGRDS